EHSLTVVLLRAVVVCHDPVPSEGSARTMASTLSCSSDRFRSGSQPAAGAKHDPVSFATSNRIRLLPQSSVNKGRAFFLALHSRQCCDALAGTRSASTEVHCRQSIWHRNLFCRRIYLLACVGGFFIRLNRFVICAFSAGLSFFALII